MHTYKKGEKVYVDCEKYPFSGKVDRMVFIVIAEDDGKEYYVPEELIKKKE